MLVIQGMTVTQSAYFEEIGPSTAFTANTLFIVSLDFLMNGLNKVLT